MGRLKDGLEGHADRWDLSLRLWRRGQFPQAMAFYGPAGIGKKRFTGAFLQYVLCQNPESAPCGECPACLRVEKKQSESVFWAEPQNGVLKIETARAILNFLGLRALSTSRWVVIEDAETMNSAFANAILKIIEEPPTATHFLFLTTSVSRLLPTVRSRLQRLSFSPLSLEEMQRLSDAPVWALKASQGRMSNLEQLTSGTSSELRERALAALVDVVRGRKEGFSALGEEARQKEPFLTLLMFQQQFLRDAMLLGNEDERAAGQVMHIDKAEALRELSAVPQECLVRAWKSVFEAEGECLAHLDRGLILENLYHDLNEVLRLEVQ